MQILYVCEGSIRGEFGRNCPLYDEYRGVRKSIAFLPEELHQISSQDQACQDFGIHPKLPVFKELYDEGSPGAQRKRGSFCFLNSIEGGFGAAARVLGFFLLYFRRRLGKDSRSRTFAERSLAFVADVGSLVEPLTPDMIGSGFHAKGGSGEICQGLFSHNDQQRAAETLTCQYLCHS